MSWAIILTVAGFLATLIGTTLLGDLCSEEIRGRLNRLPYALIRLAARRLPPDLRDDLTDDWTAELHAILHGTDKLPITRAYRGIHYALGLLLAAPTLAHTLAPYWVFIDLTRRSTNIGTRIGTRIGVGIGRVMGRASESEIDRFVQLHTSLVDSPIRLVVSLHRGNALSRVVGRVVGGALGIDPGPRFGSENVGVGGCLGFIAGIILSIAAVRGRDLTGSTDQSCAPRA